MKKKTPLKKQQIIRIMGRFNFEKVQRHMAATNWKWHDVGIPTVEQLKQHAERLLKSYHSGLMNSGSGGFTVRTDSHQNPMLSFEVAHSDTYDEE